MNQKELLMYHKNACTKMGELVELKNTNYSGNQVSTDAFVNFRRAEALNICSVEQGMLVRITDKIGRIISFTEKDFLIASDESVQDTILDAANYLLILGAYIKSKNVKNVKTLTEVFEEVVIPSAASANLCTSDVTPTTVNASPFTEEQLHEVSDYVREREAKIKQELLEKEDRELQLKRMVEVFNKETEIRTEPARQVAAMIEEVTEQFKSDTISPIIKVPEQLKEVLEEAEDNLLLQSYIPLPIEDVSFIVEGKEADIHLRTFVKDSLTTPINEDLPAEGYDEIW